MAIRGSAAMVQRLRACMPKGGIRQGPFQRRGDRSAARRTDQTIASEWRPDRTIARLIGFANRGRPPHPPQQAGEPQDQFTFDGLFGINQSSPPQPPQQAGEPQDQYGRSRGTAFKKRTQNCPAWTKPRPLRPWLPQSKCGLNDC